MFEQILPALVGQEQKADAEERLIAPNDEEAVFDQQKFLPITLATVHGRVLFVDGGNAPVFESPTARVEFVRVYGAAYEGTKKISACREEGFVLTRNITKNKQGYVEVQGYGVKLSLLILDNDQELRLGRERASLATVAGLARFCLECRLARKWREEQHCTFVVRDGSLVPNNAYEEEEFKELLQKGVAGLSKTNTLTTTTGTSVSATLLAHGPKEPWIYTLGTARGVSFSVVKLHARAEHAFRLDTNTDVATVAAALAVVATDPVFPGYPYPLVEADQQARVSKRELELLKTRFMVEAGPRWKELQLLARGSDAHGILDRNA